MSGDHLAGDRKSVPVWSAAAAATPRELVNRRRQPGPVIDELDSNRAGAGAKAALHANLNGPSPVPDRVCDQVAGRLRQPQPVGAHDRRRPGPGEPNRHPLRVGGAAPRLDGVAQQPA